MRHRFMIFLLPLLLLFHACKNPDGPINRRTLVCRHIPSVSSADSLSPFSVANGEFALLLKIPVLGK